jgi:hypothetical protein
MRLESDVAYVTGVLTNNCDAPVGVQIQLTLYDAAGRVVQSYNIWPASKSNIPARSDYPFEHQTLVAGHVSRATVKVIDTHRW